MVNNAQAYQIKLLNEICMTADCLKLIMAVGYIPYQEIILMTTMNEASIKMDRDEPG